MYNYKHVGPSMPKLTFENNTMTDIKQEFPEAEKGTYILILRLPTPSRLTIGKRGTFDFAAGWYAYVGSAMGPGGLRGRLNHHLKPVTHPHWHIDYLRQVVQCREVWYVASEEIFEHDWANALRLMPGASVPVPRFGASDCHCETHLIHFREYQELDVFNLHSEIIVQKC